METNVKYVQVICEFCNKTVEKPVRFLGYNHTFCDRTCHGNYKLANPKFCSVENCGKKRSAKGMCQSHYDLERKKNPKRLEQTRKNSKITREKIKKKREENPLFDAECRQKSREFQQKYKEQNTEKLKKADLNAWKKPKRRFNKAKRSAEERGVDFILTLDEYSHLTEKGLPCFYGCGNTTSDTGIGLDRKDNRLGYTKENVVPCCGFCNVTKNAHITSEEMLQVVKTLKELRQTDNIWENSKSSFIINKERKLL